MLIDDCSSCLLYSTHKEFLRFLFWYTRLYIFIYRLHILFFAYLRFLITSLASLAFFNHTSSAGDWLYRIILFQSQHIFFIFFIFFWKSAEKFDNLLIFKNLFFENFFIFNIVLYNRTVRRICGNTNFGICSWIRTSISRNNTRNEASKIRIKTVWNKYFIQNKSNFFKTQANF